MTHDPDSAVRATPAEEDIPEAHVVEDVVTSGEIDEPEQIHVVTGSTRDIPEPAQDVVQVEGATLEGRVKGDEKEFVRALSFSASGVPYAVDLADVAELVVCDENFVWVDLCDAPAALRELAAALHFSRHEVHAALSPWQRPALDVAGEHFFAAVTLARSDPRERQLVARQLNVFVGRNYLVSVHQQSLPFDDSVLARIRLNPDLPRLDAAYMLYILLDGLLEDYEDQADDVDEEIERMELLALVEADDAFLGELLRLKRYAYALNRLADQHRQVFEAFLRPDFPFVSGDEISAYFHDLDSRLARLLDNLAGAKESVNSAFDIYVSRVSHQTNQVVKLLTIVSTLLLPMSVILAFFGTSFASQSYLYSTPGFVFMMVLLVLITGGLILMFRRRGWF